MLIANSQLSKLLLETQLVTEDKLRSAQQLATREKISLYEAVLQRDLISDEQLGELVADALGFPFISLAKTAIKNEILGIISEIVAKKQKVIAFKKDEGGLHLAMANPSQQEIVEFIKKKTGLPIVIYLATVKDIEDSLALYRQDVAKAFEEIINESISEAKGAAKVEPPIIKIVATIISYAYQNKASDIHLEPLEKHSLVRFRVDGILYDIVQLPLDLHPRIVTRVKVMAKLRTDEHQAAQDGKLQYKTEVEELDVRVSIVPITEGEKVVMRLLSERSRQFSLKDLGMGANDLVRVGKAYKKPHGMIFATGPTGCGKTTTMYGILKILNQRKVNIMTIEDPVEYDVKNVNQIQVNPKIGLTFAKGLRSIVRQDPDIILVGEVRDKETAGIAINSAMTGHLVLSTLHTNDAATSIPRLFDMEVKPFLVASSVNVIIAQRLVREICPKCRHSIEVENKPEAFGGLSVELIKKHFGDKQTVRLYQGKACPICHHTGYVGRIGVFEVMEIDDKLREAIVSRQTAAALRKLAMEAGMTTMLDDGLEKVKQGVTTIEEVVRVTKE